MHRRKAWQQRRQRERKKAPTAAANAEQAALAASAKEGTASVKDDYLYWTGKLTDSSFQLSLGLIGANWAAFGSVQKILSNPWAKSSLALVVASLGLSLAGAKWMSELHRRQVNYADEDPDRWLRECKAAQSRNDPWPYTAQIEDLGRWLREAKLWIPIIAGVLFLIALFTAQAVPPPALAPGKIG